MEKKKKQFVQSYNVKQQYQTVLQACRIIDRAEPSSVIYNLNNINIPRWKELSKVQKFAIFFEYIVDESWVAVSLRFSEEFIENCTDKPKLADFIRRRLNENFKNRLGYVPEYLFCVEFENKNFHIHGVIQPEGNLENIKKILKITAFGRSYTKNPMPERNKVNCKHIYNRHGWGYYILKYSWHPRFDIYVSAPITRVVREKYHNLLKKQQLIKLKLQKLA